MKSALTSVCLENPVPLYTGMRIDQPDFTLEVVPQLELLLTKMPILVHENFEGIFSIGLGTSARKRLGFFYFVPRT